ncbi:M23 family metallopeptidase [Montanilutibacter psychrotolerans]|uniref:M23 family metallopeptidase n=1 Tax=Montanilutibacter psychrotolerans TaxID=1327343 RepID=UPI0011CECB94|nr:M23 family metallopeptidase [Lysobacter psychrotolerans]
MLRPGFACALALLLVSATGRAEDQLRESFDLHVPIAPTPVTTEGRVRLFYELHLTSFSAKALTPVRITVLDGQGRNLASFAGASLTQRLVPVLPETAAPADAPLSIGPGRAGVLYVELALEPQVLPQSIAHAVEYKVGDGTELDTVEGGRSVVQAVPAPVLHPPLRGGPWAAVFHPDWARGHRRVLYAVEGRARIPGRFAVDWVKLDADGRMARGNPDRVRNAYAYGNEVLAVADATVVTLRDDYPEAARISSNGRHRMRDASGNYVVLDLGDGRYAFYEHLRPGSVRVAPGQRVRRGEPIAQVGYSGSGNWPHLHFHLADAPSLLGAEGLPFALSRFRKLGAYEDFAALGKSPWVPHADATSASREGERPADNAVIWFGDEQKVVP